MSETAICKLVGEYSNIVGPHGPDSEQAKIFRATHADNQELMEYADALDRIKRHLGGKGMTPRSKMACNPKSAQKHESPQPNVVEAWAIQEPLGGMPFLSFTTTGPGFAWRRYIPENGVPFDEVKAKLEAQGYREVRVRITPMPD